MVRRAAVLAFVVGILAGNSASGAESVTYCRDVAPILFKNCSGCHHPGEVAPFSLLSYQDAAKRAKTLARVTRTRYMPPFKAEPGAGEFRDVCRLSDAEIATIQRWTESGAAEGDPATMPAVPVFSDTWKLGKPDLIVSMPKAFTIPAEGKDIYQCFVLPADLPEDRYLIGYEFRAGNRTVVHHSIISQDVSGDAIRTEAAAKGVGFRANGTGTGVKGGFNSVLAIWTPGVVPSLFPDGVGLRVLKGSVIVIQNHYHPSGKEETDQSSIGLYFAKTPPSQLAHYTTLFQNKIAIAPGEKHYTVSAQQTAGGGRIVAVTPHMHLIGDELKLTATLADGSVKPMIWIKNWDFNWQHQYFYATPVAIERGTKLELTATFDNSAENPRNPNSPPKAIRFGENTTDEMAGVILLVVDDHPQANGVASKGMGMTATAAIKVDSKVLDRYTGQFTLEIPMTLEIVQESGVLKAKVGDKSGKVELVATAENEFVSHNPEAKLIFAKDENGDFSKLTLLASGKSHVGTRVKK